MNSCLKFSTSLLVCLASSAALADTTNGYGVATAARAWDLYSFVPFVSAFRMSGDSSGNYTAVGDTPSLMLDGCAQFPPEAVCSGGTAGTGGTNYNLTASHNTAWRSSWGSNVQSTAWASASANLATGELAVVATSDRYAASSGFPSYNQGTGSAHLNDTLTFSVAGANASTVTLIGVELILHGALGIADLRGSANLQSQLYFGSAAMQFNASIGAGSSIVSETHTSSGWTSANWDINLNELGQPDGSFRFSGVYALTGASSVIGLGEKLYAVAGASGTADYGSTSHLALMLPDHVTYDSNSGVFLSAVPEPGSWAMMLAGLAGLGLVARRRQV